MKILLVDDVPSEHRSAEQWVKKITHVLAIAQKHPDVMQKISDIVCDVHSNRIEKENEDSKKDHIEELLECARKYDLAQDGEANLEAGQLGYVENIFELISAQSVEEARKKMSDNIDIAVVDMKLDKDRDNGGEDVVNYITELCMRIPVYIYTGTDTGISVNYYLKMTKGEKSFGHIFIDCYALFKTGIINIIKKKALIDQKLLLIFQKNLTISLREANWLKHALIDSQKTEKALLRYTINHMLQFLDEDEEKYYPEEMYIYPPVQPQIQTGRILCCNDTHTFLVVVSPACDIALHDGKPKSNQVQFAEIEGFDYAVKKRNPSEIKKMKQNNFQLFYHYLPKTGVFPGGFINFKKIHSLKRNHLDHLTHILQISPSFCKDIISRFSSYYARQGQPVIEENS